jgi:hypothetical protein
MVSPWILSFAPGLSPITSAEIAGIVVTVLGIWAIAEHPGRLARRHKRPDTP